MSNFNGRRGPNVSQYLRDLNAINRQETAHEEPFNMEEDLALFTNTQFFDFETNQTTDYQAQPLKVDIEAAQSTSPSDGMTPAPSVVGDINPSSFDFIQGDFSFPDFTSTYPSTPLNGFADGAQNFPSMQPNAPAGYQPVQQQQQASHYNQQATPQPSTEKHGSESGPGAGRGSLNFEEASRHAAEEDKRRRNTAASARFRIKKKQREQALEKSAKEMSEKVSVLESKVQQLEMENKWLKNLLVEKNEGNDEIVTLWKEFAASKSTDKPESKAKSAVKEETR
ncbi:regulatory cys-3 [Fusarium subglutinans]|uniref:Regulatory cys-3 n=1 Tax=Gibberella subglutinans TaxID=42677 RepID=A0A8H5L3H2_GIBSU|nr:regulatory cys-3 [Fusarium subglutinans]KAF5583586.1 regulatory cys-3 [Fusarium subglutinans]